MCEYGFAENTDYRVIVKNDENSKGGRPSTDYEITLDCKVETKDGEQIICRQLPQTP